jgi:myosin heavy subunit
MNTLDATSPHFLRCIIPNEIKTGGNVDPKSHPISCGLFNSTLAILEAHDFMHQLHCNGVQKVIHMYHKGYSSRLLFSEFIARILAATRVKVKGSDMKAASA